MELFCSNVSRIESRPRWIDENLFIKAVAATAINLLISDMEFRCKNY